MAKEDSTLMYVGIGVAILLFLRSRSAPAASASASATAVAAAPVTVTTQRFAAPGHVIYNEKGEPVAMTQGIRQMPGGGKIPILLGPPIKVTDITEGDPVTDFSPAHEATGIY